MQIKEHEEKKGSALNPPALTCCAGRGKIAVRGILQAAFLSYQSRVVSNFVFIITRFRSKLGLLKIV
jgi:hypothetical protein